VTGLQAKDDAIASTVAALRTEVDVGGVFRGVPPGPPHRLRCVSSLSAAWDNMCFAWSIFCRLLRVPAGLVLRKLPCAHTHTIVRHLSHQALTLAKLHHEKAMWRLLPAMSVVSPDACCPPCQ
jgi:hypothetical protein